MEKEEDSPRSERSRLESVESRSAYQIVLQSNLIAMTLPARILHIMSMEMRNDLPNHFQLADEAVSIPFEDLQVPVFLIVPNTPPTPRPTSLGDRLVKLEEGAPERRSSNGLTLEVWRLENEVGVKAVLDDVGDSPRRGGCNKG